MLLFAGELIKALFKIWCQACGALLRLNVSVIEIFNKVRHSITPYLSDLLMIFRSSSSTSSVGIPSERSMFRNSFIPLIERLHSKSVSFSFVFLLNIKFDLLAFGNTILQGGLCFVECMNLKTLYLFVITPVPSEGTIIKSLNTILASSEFNISASS